MKGGKFGRLMVIGAFLWAVEALSQSQTQLHLGEAVLDLSGMWKIAYDPKNLGLQQNWQKSRPSALHDIRVPSCFEETPEGAAYDGVAWYYHTFRIPDSFRGKTLYLEFDAVNYACRVWLNGTEIGAHEGGYHRFQLPLGNAARLNEENQLVLRVVDPGRQAVDGWTLRAIPNGKESWYFNFGGIYGAVRLLGKPPLSIEDIHIMADPATGKVTAALEIERRAGGPAQTLLRARVFAIQGVQSPPAVREVPITLEPGLNRRTVELQVEKPALWSPSQTALYGFGTALEGGQEKKVTFGFRTFTIEQGDFRLNGKPVFLKAALRQPYELGALALPPGRDPRFNGVAESEILRIKAAGFNVVRLHAAVAPEWYLDAADRLGLMVIAEPSIGWVYGPLDQIVKPCLAEMSEMVRRDRNHPCIIAWGTISGGGGDVGKAGDLLARQALQLDPTRPVFGDWPDRWTESNERGAAKVYLPNQADGIPMGSGQIFVHSPLTAEERTRLQTLGKTTNLNFVSAIGASGMSNPKIVLDNFRNKDNLEDYRLYKQYNDLSLSDFNNKKIRLIFNDIGNLFTVSEDLQAKTAVEIVSVLRANPNLDGYCYSQWNDAAWEYGAGILDAAGRPKRVHDHLAHVQRSPSVTVICTPECPSPGQTVRIQPLILNDGFTSGTYYLEVQVFSPNNKRVSQRQNEVVLSATQRVAALEPLECRLSGPTGHCRIRSVLSDPSNRRGNRPAETEQRILYVSDDQWDLSRYDLLAFDSSGARRSVLSASGIAPLSPPAWPRSRIFLVAAQGPAWRQRERFEPLAEALEGISTDGGTLLLDCSGGIDPAVARIRLLQGKTVRLAGGFVGQFCFGGTAHWLHWLMQRQALGSEFRSIIPQYALATDEPEWHPAIIVMDNYGRLTGMAAAERAWGAGRVIAFTLPVFDRLDRDPAARLFCSTLFRYCSDNQRMGGPGNVDRRQILARFDGTGETAPTDWWVCGPFACRDLADGLQRAFPPETGFNTAHVYEGTGAETARWRRHRSDRVGFLNLISAVGQHTNAAAYALTHLHVKTRTATKLRLGSDDAVKVFLNGRMVFEKLVQRPASPDEDRVDIVLEAGWNTLVLKVVNATGEWAAYVSLDEPVLWSADRETATSGK
ncbi:MAG: hypothetical protein N3D11_03170 [Candidatus Sumerlaeia bacterium]|nr:hypothetical protein [Candidatus Sumerlaeia bacterium]